MKLSKRGKAILSWLLALLVILLLLGLAEGAVRVRQWWKYGSAETLEATYGEDEKTGLRVPKAGKRTGTLSINSLGFRGPELELPKPEGRLRLAFLGASTTFCAEVSSNAATWPQLVAAQLDAAAPGVSVDYVNAGVPGYVVSTSSRNLGQRVAALDPDIIFIYHATNDLSRETRDLAARQGLYGEEQKPQPGWLARHSLLWSLVQKNFRVMLAQRQAAAEKDRLQFRSDEIGDSFYRDLTALVREAKEVAPVVAIATFSSRLRPEQSGQERLDAAVSALYYMPYMTPEGLIQGFERYNDIIRRVAREQGIILVEGENLIPGDAVHFNDSVHFTDAGSRLMAERVAKALLGAEPVQRVLASRAR